MAKTLYGLKLRYMNRIKCLFRICVAVVVMSSCSKENETVSDAGTTDQFIKHHRTIDSIFTINKMVQLSDSSFILAGGVKIKGSSDKNVIMKLDKFGNRDWLNVMDDTSSPKGLEAIFVDGNSYIGYRNRGYNGDSSPPSLIRFSKTGGVLRKFPIDGEFLAYDIIRDEDSFIIAGRNNMLIKKIGINGEIHWTRIFQYYPTAFSISKLKDGNYVVIGGYNDTATGEFLIKLSTSGEIIWSKVDKGMKVLALPDNGFVAVAGLYDELSIVRFDENGIRLWKKPIDNLGSISERTVSLFNYDLGYFVYSYYNTNYDLNICVLDSDGNNVNTLTVKDLDTGTFGQFNVAIIKTLDGGLFIVRSANSWELKLIKLSPESVF